MSRIKHNRMSRAQYGKNGLWRRQNGHREILIEVIECYDLKGNLVGYQERWEPRADFNPLPESANIYDQILHNMKRPPLPRNSR